MVYWLRIKKNFPAKYAEGRESISMKKQYLPALIFLVVFALNAFGQAPAKIEQELIKHATNIDDWTMRNDRTGEEMTEAIEKEHQIFQTKLLKYTKQLSTLKYNFNDLSKHLSIATSADGKFRVYSRDLQGGGTMHFFETIYQYQASDGKVYSQIQDLEEGDPGGFVYDIFTLNLKKGNVYMVCTTGIGSTQDHGQNLRLFQVEGRKLNKSVKLIKTKSGLTDSIGFSYNFFSVVDRPERPIKLFTYDNRTNTFTFPVVIEDNEFGNGRVTDKLISYRFNGTYFVKLK